MFSRNLSVSRITTFTTGVALGLSLLSGTASAGAATPHHPSGSKGVIKVDAIGTDDSPASEPHVACSFEIDFFGFDLGARADIRFFAQAPSGNGQLLHEDLAVLVSDDAADGGADDVDAAVPYDASNWDLSALTPSAQGIHVKVEADVDGASGGTEQKVFWIDCPPVVLIPPIVIESPDPTPPVDQQPPADGFPPVVDVVPPVDEVPSVDPLPPVETTTPPVVVDDAVPPPPIHVDVEVEVVEPGSTEVPPVVIVSPESPAQPDGPAAVTTPDVEGEWAISARVLGVNTQRRVLAVTSGSAPQVLGVRITADDTLPRTGGHTGLLAMLAILLVLVGTTLTRLGRIPTTSKGGDRTTQA